jgi:hypothetical protein
MSILCWRWSLYSTWPFPFRPSNPPMLSVLLCVEELELLVIPYCHVFENHLHFFSLWLICPSTSSYYHQAMVPILRHIVITDFHPVLVAASSSTVFILSSRTEHVLKHPSKLKFIRLSFQQAIIRMKRVPNKRVMPILLWRCNLSKADFRLRGTQCFCHISLYGSSKLMIIDGLEIRFEGASEYELFFHCISLNTCSNFDWNSTFPLKPCRWKTILIAIGQKLMGILLHACKTIHSTPGVMVGSSNNCQQIKCFPKILTCGKAHLVKRKART